MLCVDVDMFVKLSAVCLLTQLNFYLLTYLLIINNNYILFALDTQLPKALEISSHILRNDHYNCVSIRIRIELKQCITFCIGP